MRSVFLSTLALTLTLTLAVPAPALPNCSHKSLQPPPPHLTCGAWGGSYQEASPISQLAAPSNNVETCVAACHADANCASFQHDALYDVCYLYRVSIAAQAVREEGIVTGPYGHFRWWDRKCFHKECE